MLTVCAMSFSFWTCLTFKVRTGFFATLLRDWYAELRGYFSKNRFVLVGCALTQYDSIDWAQSCGVEAMRFICGMVWNHYSPFLFVREQGMALYIDCCQHVGKAISIHQGITG